MVGRDEGCLTRGWESRGRLANPGLPGNGFITVCVRVLLLMMMMYFILYSIVSLAVCATTTSINPQNMCKPRND